MLGSPFRASMVGDFCCLEFRGTILWRDVPQFHEVMKELHQVGHTSFLFDLRELEMIDSAGITALIHWKNKLEDGKGEIWLRVLPDSSLMDLLHVVGITKAFPCICTDNDMDDFIDNTGRPFPYNPQHVVDRVEVRQLPREQLRKAMKPFEKVTDREASVGMKLSLLDQILQLLGG